MKLAVTAMLALVCAAALGACGSTEVKVSKASPYYNGAVMFRNHCSGCHTLSVVGATGSATSIGNRVKTNGPELQHPQGEPRTGPLRDSQRRLLRRDHA